MIRSDGRFTLPVQPEIPRRRRFSRKMHTEILECCNTVEECYEFMLAYAAKGLPSEQGSQAGEQICEYLRRAADAITGLVEWCAVGPKEGGLEPVKKYEAFFAVIDRDARDSLAA